MCLLALETFFATLSPIRKKFNSKNDKMNDNRLDDYQKPQIDIQASFFPVKIKNIHDYSPKIDPYSSKSPKRPYIQ